ncbi:MAG: type IV secretory system conjugative DNA transfer family protein [Clostridia bacterium]|jgi:type IV secretion system protein VirD4|nr:type IV secretory system conjugative DNA transfer family protein [Clostridia bacterium]
MKKHLGLSAFVVGSILFYIAAMWFAGLIVQISKTNLLGSIIEDSKYVLTQDTAFVDYSFEISKSAMGETFLVHPLTYFVNILSNVRYLAIYFIVITLIYSVYYFFHNPIKFKKKEKKKEVRVETEWADETDLKTFEKDNLISKKQAGLALGSIKTIKKTKVSTNEVTNIYSLSNDIHSINNMLVIGGSGTKKSRSFVKPSIINLSNENHSIIVTDPKAELFEETSKYLEKKGYEVKVLNLSNLSLSNKWNPLSVVDTEMSALYLANIIIDSDKKDSDDINHQAELYLLKSLILYVKGYLPKKEQTLGDIYKLISTSNYKTLDSIFSNIPNHKTCKVTYNLFSKLNEESKEKILLNLISKLQIFSMPEVKNLTSINDINIENPKKKPCAFYCIFSNEYQSLNLIANMFFSFLFYRLSNIHDISTSDDIKNRKVFFMLDDFQNIGEIPNFKKRISNMLSRNLFCSLILQNISQIKNMYPDSWSEIISNFETTLFMGSNDQKTLEFMSNEVGHKRLIKDHSNIIDTNELKNLDENKCIITIKSKKPIIFNKINWNTYIEAYHLNDFKNSITNFEENDSFFEEYVSIEENRTTIDTITDNTKYQLDNHQIFKQFKRLKPLLSENITLDEVKIDSDSSEMLNKQLTHLVSKIKNKENEEN